MSVYEFIMNGMCEQCDQDPADCINKGECKFDVAETDDLFDDTDYTTDEPFDIVALRVECDRLREERDEAYAIIDAHEDRINTLQEDLWRAQDDVIRYSQENDRLRAELVNLNPAMADEV